ncbi:hypothetical protein [Rubritalea sp.]|uniref:hypothetical protein n=1 Tax=Rubritalea sp. TaxID=2109375 RepID=UPI003EF8A2D9
MQRPSLDNPYIKDFNSSSDKIIVRRENIGEIGRWVEGDYWHLNQSFNDRSLFFGSGIDAFIDPYEQFLILRDAAVILLFDYTTGLCWNSEGPWNPSLTLGDFPKINYTAEYILLGTSHIKVPRDELTKFFTLGLGRSKDGFLTHWRPESGHSNKYSHRLEDVSSLLQN